MHLIALPLTIGSFTRAGRRFFPNTAFLVRKNHLPKKDLMNILELLFQNKNPVLNLLTY
jgi:hypothetical protein